MTRIVYVNGAYKRYAEAAIHAEDRGFQFADAIYEVIEVRDGKLVDATRHLSRLDNSLAELAIPRPMSDAALLIIITRVIRLNAVRNGVVYMQVTRGGGPRDFALPSADTPPTLVVLARQLRAGMADERALEGIAVKTMPDPRWARCDIKTVMLLPAVLAKEEARKEGAREVWFLDAKGAITEGGSSNAWIVTDKGVLVTRQLDPSILPGVTRLTVLDVAKALGLDVEERPFNRSEALAAQEAFLTSATQTVMPIIKIDEKLVADGRPGAIAKRLRKEFYRFAAFSGA